MKIRLDLRTWVAALGLTLMVGSAAHAAAVLELPELMALLSQKRSGDASFVEQRFVKGLDQPLRTTGTISFVAPDRFTRSTLEPRAESIAVEGNSVTMKRGGRSRTLTLDAVPEAAVIVEAVRGTLTGNAASLQRYFKLALGGDAEVWTLDLVPIESRLVAQVRSLRIGGKRGEVLSVEVQLADGDRSVMAIDPKGDSRADPKVDSKADPKAEAAPRAASSP